jgi:hypothetical protein
MRKYLALLTLLLAVPAIPSYAGSFDHIDPNVTYPLLNGNTSSSTGSKGNGNSGAQSGTGRKSAPGRSSPGAETRNYYSEVNPDLTPEKALQQQNGAIQQYSKMGYQLEAKHQWDKAEKVFEYVLKVSAIRDGVGSPKMVPVLQHLAVVTSEQGRTQEAIGYQERVLGFAKNQPDQTQIINAGVGLAKLYLLLPDLDKAEATAQKAYKLSQDTVSIAPSKKQEIAHFYGTLLRKINKEGQAELIDPVASGKDANKDASKDATNKITSITDAPNKDASNKDIPSKDASSKDATTKASSQEAPSTKSN